MAGLRRYPPAHCFGDAHHESGRGPIRQTLSSGGFSDRSEHGPQPLGADEAQAFARQAAGRRRQYSGRFAESGMECPSGMPAIVRVTRCP